MHTRPYNRQGKLVAWTRKACGRVEERESCEARRGLGRMSRRKRRDWGWMLSN
jgi:hypothetical protein